MSTSTKINNNNKIMKYAITDHFAEQGKRMSTLTKAKKDNLISIIEKYNIDVEKYAKELKEQEKERQYVASGLLNHRVHVSIERSFGRIPTEFFRPVLGR